MSIDDARGSSVEDPFKLSFKKPFSTYDSLVRAV